MSPALVEEPQSLPVKPPTPPPPSPPRHCHRKAPTVADLLQRCKWPRWSTPICPRFTARRRLICLVLRWALQSPPVILPAAAVPVPAHSIGVQQPQSIIINCNASSDAALRCHCSCNRSQRAVVRRQQLQRVRQQWLLWPWLPKGNSARPSCIDVTVFVRQALPACRQHRRRTHHRRLHHQRQRPPHWPLPRIMVHSRLLITT